MGKYVRALSKSSIWRLDILIFITLGTQDKEFTRLIKEIEELKKDGIIKEKVVIQAGTTKYLSDELEIIDYLSMEEFEKYIKKSKFIITHGGVGSILDAIKHNKKVIAVPRLAKYDEHENNHQIQIVEKFAELGYIIDAGNLKRLKDKILKIDEFKPKKFVSNNSKMIKLIEDYIGE